MASLDAQWAAEVARICDRVFEAADVGFTRQVQHADPQGVMPTSLLWEADPARFAERYPDSGVVESYGPDQWPGVGCIDFWVYVDRDAKQCRLSLEGWNLPEFVLELSGHGGLDGGSIAAVFARILGVTWAP